MTASLPPKNHNIESLTYAKSGVDIDAGNALVKRISPLAKATKRAGVMSGLGGFGGLFDLKACGYDDPILVSGTDGVGTKLELAQQMNLHDSIGIDLVAMCVNDIITQGAEPLFFLDYFACGKLSVDVAEAVVAGIAKGCELSGCSLLGGETAEMPGMYEAGSYDLAGFTVGAVERADMLPRMDDMKAGNVLLGLSSDGVHSNGFSLVRKIVERSGVALNDTAPFDANKTLGETLLMPTRLYVKSCLAALKEVTIHGMAHITGGGWSENIPRVLPENLAAEIDLSSYTMPSLFAWLQEQGNVETQEMLRTFNCGIGMVVVVPEEAAEKATATFEAQGETVTRLGRLVEKKSDDVVYL